jgi:hypothetical protein
MLKRHPSRGLARLCEVQPKDVFIMLWVIEFVGKRKFFDQLAEDVFFS